jgi:hypothetical protein
MNEPERRLATREINLLLHLMKVGAGGLMPVLALRSARPVATQLWRMGLVNVWTRQSLIQGRPEGPFYSLTPRGRELAALLHFSRTSRTEGGLRERAEAQIPSTYEDAA